MLLLLHLFFSCDGIFKLVSVSAQEVFYNFSVTCRFVFLLTFIVLTIFKLFILDFSVAYNFLRPTPKQTKLLVLIWEVSQEPVNYALTHTGHNCQSHWLHNRVLSEFHRIITYLEFPTIVINSSFHNYYLWVSIYCH